MVSRLTWTIARGVIAIAASIVEVRLFLATIIAA
jgi:hypothetical protein